MTLTNISIDTAVIDTAVALQQKTEEVVNRLAFIRDQFDDFDPAWLLVEYANLLNDVDAMNIVAQTITMETQFREDIPELLDMVSHSVRQLYHTATFNRSEFPDISNQIIAEVHEYHNDAY